MDGTDSNIHAAAAVSGNKPTPVAIYCRTAQQSETAINHQRAICQAYAQDRGWFVTDCFVDDGYSGLSASRPGLKSMLRAAKRASPPFQKILIADEVRLYRDRKKFVSLFWWLTDRGIDLWTVEGQVESLGASLEQPSETDRRSRSFGIRQSIRRIQEVTLTLARLIGRQIARELHERSDRNP